MRERFLTHAGDNDRAVRDLTFSPIRGPEGNIEYLGWLEAGGHTDALPDLDELVRRSHESLEKTP